MGVLKNFHIYPSYLSSLHMTEKLNDECFFLKNTENLKKSNVYK